MTMRVPLASYLAPDRAKDELVRRFALASEPAGEPVERPHLLRLAGELDTLIEPMRRPFRRLEIARTARPRTVMILPGFFTGPRRMRYLAHQIERAGHTTKRWGMGHNFGASEEMFERLEERLLDLRRLTGEPLVLLGWSLGGVFARELAKRHPECAAKVITMGSPFSGSPKANNVWRAYQFIAGHRVDQPPVEADVAAKPPVETVALWSARDGMIAPGSACGLPHERDREVELGCTHIGFSYAPEAIHAILNEIERS